MSGKVFFLAFLMIVIFISLGNVQVVIFEENFNDFTAWRPAPENGAGCEWTAENGWAKIKSMGTNPGGTFLQFMNVIYHNPFPLAKTSHLKRIFVVRMVTHLDGPATVTWNL